MESLPLRIFREVACEQSISKAAEKLNYAQSNITAHIHHLEEELQTVLFVRHNKGVSLTEDGIKLLHYADQIVHLLDTAKRQFLIKEPALKIGATQTIAAHRLPVWLSAFKRSSPDTAVSVSTDTQASLVQAVADGKLDCAFVNTAFNHPQLVSAYSFPEKLAFVAPHTVDPDQLPYQSFIVTNIPGCPYRGLLEDWSIHTALYPPRFIEFDTLEGILKAVSLGMGISLLPTSVLDGMQSLQILPAKQMGETHIHLVVPKGIENETLPAFIQTVTSHRDMELEK